MSTEPIVPESAPVETPVIPDPITPDVGIEPELPTTPEEPELTLSDEELDAAIEAILKDMPSTVATEPTFSTGKEELKQEVNALDAMIDEFTQSEAAKAELESRIEAIHAEKEQFRSDVQSSYKKISDVIGLDLAEQITSEDQGDIPLHLYSDKMEKVYAHPFFGPHIKTLLEGGEVDLPKLLKETLSRTRIPNIAATPTTQTPETTPPNATNSLISRLRAGHRM